MPHTRTPLRTVFRHTHHRTLARLATATATTLIAGAFVTGAATGTAAAAPLEDDRSVTVTTDEYRVDKEVVGSNEKVPGSTVTYRTSFSPTDAPEYFNWVSDEYAPGLTFVTGTLYLSDTNGTKTALDTSPYVSPEGDTPHVSFRPGDIWVGPGWALVYEVTYIIRADRFEPGDVIASGISAGGWNDTADFDRNPIGVNVHVVSPFASGSAS
ncbi:hypothetical protein [Rhodococcus sp. NPDC003348]